MGFYFFFLSWEQRGQNLVERKVKSQHLWSNMNPEFTVSKDLFQDTKALIQIFLLKKSYFLFFLFCHPPPPLSTDQCALQYICFNHSLTIFLLVLLSDPHRQNETIRWSTVEVESTQLKSSSPSKSLFLVCWNFPTFNHKFWNHY